MCGKDHMDVHLSFSAPFDGIVSSKGKRSPTFFQISQIDESFWLKIESTSFFIFFKKIVIKSFINNLYAYYENDNQLFSLRSLAIFFMFLCDDD